MAPEVMGRKYGTEADLWSLGVLLYQLVSGFLPYVAEDIETLKDKVKNEEWQFAPTFNKISPECKNLISWLLVKDPKERISGQDALNHDWFKKVMEKPDEEFEVDEQVINRLLEFEG